MIIGIYVPSMSPQCLIAHLFILSYVRLCGGTATYLSIPLLMVTLVASKFGNYE